MQNAFYVGFVAFAELLAASTNKVIYLAKSVSTRPGPAPFHLGERVWYITAAAFENGVCHYFRLKIGARQVYGEPFPEESEYDKACGKRSSSALEALTEIAREQQFNVISAMPTFPENLVLLSGGIEGLDFNAEENLFTRQAKQEPEKLAA